MQLRIAVPNKGRLAQPSLQLLDSIGLPLGTEALEQRKLFARVGAKTVVLLARAADIPQYVASGAADVGISGTDLLQESGAVVRSLLPLGFGSCRLVLAVPEASPIEGPADVPKGARVATSFPRLARRYFDKHNLQVQVVEVSGAAELTPQIGVSDMIVDLAATGATLQGNHLREVATLLDSQAELVGNPGFCESAAERVEELVATTRSVLDARERRYLMANVPRSRLQEVRSVMPGLGGPTVMDLLGRPEWVAMHAVVGAREVNGIVSALRSMGASGILVLPIERMVP